jgi:hypothetical protein
MEKLLKTDLCYINPVRLGAEIYNIGGGGIKIDGLYGETV